MFHYRTLQTYVVPSENALTNPHPYQTRISIALAAPSEKNSCMHSNQLLIALVTHHSYLLSYGQTVLPMYRQAFGSKGFLEPCVSPIIPFVIFMNLSADGCTAAVQLNFIFLAMDA